MYLICNIERSTSFLGHRDLASRGGFKIPNNVLIAGMIKYCFCVEWHPELGSGDHRIDAVIKIWQLPLGYVSDSAMTLSLIQDFQVAESETFHSQRLPSLSRLDKIRVRGTFPSDHSVQATLHTGRMYELLNNKMLSFSDKLHHLPWHQALD